MTSRFVFAATVLAPTPSRAATPDDTTGVPPGDVEPAVEADPARAPVRPARAVGPVSRRFRLGVDAEFFGVGHVFLPGRPAGEGYSVFGAGVGRAVLPQQSFNAGLESYAPVGATPPIGVHGAVVVLGGRGLAGGRLALSIGGAAGQASLSTGEESSSSFLLSGELIPYFRWLFGDGKVRPYLEVHAGIGGVLVRSGKVTSQTLTPLLGMGSGAMMFVVPRVSIDLGVGLDVAAPLVRWRGSGGLDLLSINLVANITTGLSLWF